MISFISQNTFSDVTWIKKVYCHTFKLLLRLICCSDDHRVTKHEFVTRFAHNEPELNIIGEGLFLEFDMNQDGSITVADLDLYYQKIDTNSE